MQNNNHAPYGQAPQQAPAATYGQAAPAFDKSQPLDKGRIMGVVDEYQARENGQPLVNPDGSPKMKPKWWPIGECTMWQGENGPYEKRTIFVKPLKPGIYEEKTFWDSQNPNQQQR
jgi:hypothetical protein